MILRGYNLEEVRAVAEILTTSKYVRNMEITLNTEGALEIIKEISDEFGEQLNVGAGTVQTFDELKGAIHHGACFVLSPRRMTKEMLDYCKENNVISVPGSFSPSEIAESYANGADVVKVFPANEVTLSYANKVKEPCGDIPLMAVGGINKHNVKEALESGYDYLGTAGGLFSKNNIKNLDKNALLKELQEFEAELVDFL